MSDIEDRRDNPWFGQFANVPTGDTLNDAMVNLLPPGPARGGVIEPVSFDRRATSPLADQLGMQNVIDRALDPSLLTPQPARDAALVKAQAGQYNIAKQRGNNWVPEDWRGPTRAFAGAGGGNEQASNYSIQPRYPYPQSPPMGSLAAADSYSPSDWPAGAPELPDIGAPLLSPGPQVSSGQPWAKKLVDTLTTPRPAEDDNTVLYKTASPKVNFTQADINRGLDLGLSFSGGGLGIKAYHGSPHDFDRFDLSKIGTGEGAQAYGHGLYFADQEATAKAYRDALSSAHTNDLRAEGLSWLEKAKNDPTMAEKLYRDTAATNNEAIEPSVISAIKAPAGRMYEVNINADPVHFLDWDKPVAQQKAYEALRAHWDSKIGDPDIISQRMGILPTSPGERLYSGIGGINQNQQAATDMLHKAGIPGIKYLDQGSRTAGQGSSNYVVFNDKLIDILRKYGIAGAAPAGMGALAAQDNYPPQ